MLDFFYTSKRNSVIVFEIHNRQLATEEKNVVVENNKLLKVFICFDFNLLVVEIFHFVHEIMKKVLNLRFECAHRFFNLIVFQCFQFVEIIFRNHDHVVNSVIEAAMSIFVF